MTGVNEVELFGLILVGIITIGSFITALFDLFTGDPQ